MSSHQKDYIRGSLQNAFQRFSSLPLDTLLDLKDYTRFLDFLAREEFDREIATELFSQCPKKRQQFITLDDFVDIFFKAEDELVRQISIANVKLSQLHEKREDILMRLNEYPETQANSQSQLINLTVGIHIAQVNSLTWENGEGAFQIIAECSGVRKATDYSDNFYFEQTLSMEIPQANAQVLRLLLKKRGNTRESGSIQVDLRNFTFNKKVTLREQFSGTPVFLQFSVGILVPKNDRYADEAKFEDKKKKILEKEQQLRESDMNLKILYKLLRHLDDINSQQPQKLAQIQQDLRLTKNIQYLKNNDQQDYRFGGDTNNKNDLSGFGLQQSYQQYQGNTQQQQQQQQLQRNNYQQLQPLQQLNQQQLANNTSIQFPQSAHHPQYSISELKLIQKFKVYTLVLLCLSALQSLQKPSFLEIGTLLGIIGLVSSDSLDSYYTILLSCLLALQFAFDFTWAMLFNLQTYSNRFSAILGTDNDNFNSTHLLSSICFILMLICFFYKFFYAFILYNYYQEIAININRITDKHQSQQHNEIQ